MMATPALYAIETSRSRNFAVGIDETVCLNCLPRLPVPIVSRPVARASAKFRSSQAIDPQPYVTAMSNSCLRAYRRLALFCPVVPLLVYAMVMGSPTGFPSGVITQPAI